MAKKAKKIRFDSFPESATKLTEAKFDPPNSIHVRFKDGHSGSFDAAKLKCKSDSIGPKSVCFCEWDNYLEVRGSDGKWHTVFPDIVRSLVDPVYAKALREAIKEDVAAERKEG